MVKTDSDAFNIFGGMVSFIFITYINLLTLLVYGLTYNLLIPVVITVFLFTIVMQINKGTKLKGLKRMLSDSLETLTKTENILETENGTYNSVEVEKIMDLKRKVLNIKLVLQMDKKINKKRGLSK